LLAVFFALNEAGRDGPDRLSFVQGISADRLIQARAAATGVLVLGVGGACVLTGAPFVPVAWSISSATRVALIIGIIGAYGLLWLAFAIIAYRFSCGRGLARLFTLWLLLVVLVPLAIDRIAGWARPIPSRGEALEAVRTAPERVASSDQNALMIAFLERHPDYPRPDTLAPLGRIYLEGAARSEARDELIERDEQRIVEAAARQQRLVDLLSMASPPALLQRCLTALAGTDRERYDRFLRLTAAYEQEYRRFFNQRRFALPRSVFKADDYERIPRMKYEEEPVRAVVARSVWPFGTLLGYCCAATALALAGPRLGSSRPLSGPSVR
jgi:hypothetical protein